eukprot:gene6794-9307_t
MHTQIVVWVLFGLLSCAIGFIHNRPSLQYSKMLMAKAKGKEIKETIVVKVEEKKIPVVKEERKYLTKTELVDLIVSDVSEKISKKTADAFLSRFADVLKSEVLIGGKELRIPKLGTFKQKIFAARKGRNPRTGEELDLSSSKSISFKPSSLMKMSGKDEEEMLEVMNMFGDDEEDDD